MSKKISEKELNNVSGGCGGNTTDLYYKLYCYDANNTQIGPVVETKHSPYGNDAMLYMGDKSKELYLSNEKIKYIKWEKFNGSTKDNDGINYREIMLS